MRPMIVLVTGATDGIGKQTAVDLAKRGAHVIVHGRNAQKVERVKSELKNASGVVADLSSLEEVRTLAKNVVAMHPQIDVVIHNAGVFMNERVLTKDGFETTFAVNHLAPFLLTHLLRPAIRARIVVVSSIAHTRGHMQWDNLQGEKRFDGYDAYAMSKLANVLFTVEMAKHLGAKPTINALHPGVVSTKLLKEGFGGMRGPDSHEDGAATSVYLATSSEVEGQTGGYYVRCAPASPSKEARDPDVAKKLYEISAKLVQQ